MTREPDDSPTPAPVPAPVSCGQDSLGEAGEEGMVLILVLLVLGLISVLILAWVQEWRVELKLAGNFRTVHQSRRLAEAGVYYALGKLLAARAASAAPAPLDQAPEDLWQGDQNSHWLEFPAGAAEVRVADEGGKINLNLAPETMLRSLFAVLGVSEPRLAIMVDSILDWRSQGDKPRPHGAKSDYYLGLQPPYVAKNGKFDVVEELAWVRGFEAYPLLPRLGDWLTIHRRPGIMGNAINIKTAPLEVLEAIGYSPEKAEALLAARQTATSQNLAESHQAAREAGGGQAVQISTQPSPFFTITAVGGAKGQEGRYTIRAVVQLETKGDQPWEIVSWYDGFPANP